MLSNFVSSHTSDNQIRLPLLGHLILLTYSYDCRPNWTLPLLIVFGVLHFFCVNLYLVQNMPEAKWCTAVAIKKCF